MGGGGGGGGGGAVSVPGLGCHLLPLDMTAHAGLLFQFWIFLSYFRDFYKVVYFMCRGELMPWITFKAAHEIILTLYIHTSSIKPKIGHKKFVTNKRGM